MKTNDADEPRGDFFKVKLRRSYSTLVLNTQGSFYQPDGVDVKVSKHACRRLMIVFTEPTELCISSDVPPATPMRAAAAAAANDGEQPNYG